MNKYAIPFQLNHANQMIIVQAKVHNQPCTKEWFGVEVGLCSVLQEHLLSWFSSPVPRWQRGVENEAKYYISVSHHHFHVQVQTFQVILFSVDSTVNWQTHS